MVLGRIGSEAKPHDAINCDVKNGTDRPEEEHETPDVSRVLLLRTFEEFVVDVVERNRIQEELISKFLDIPFKPL